MSPLPGAGASNPTGSGNSIYKAVVLDVMINRSSISLMENLSGIKNPAKLKSAPLNSCIVKFYGSSAPPEKSAIVAYPFFPPHLGMPIQPGEIVWIISPTIDQPDINDCFWICRVTGDHGVDDLNFTHLFRSSTQSSQAQMIQPRSSQKWAQPTPSQMYNEVPGFLNSKDGTTPIKLAPSKALESIEPVNPFDMIVTQSVAYKTFVGEPVPHFSKRPGDLVIQGSNNSLICLGQDRAYNVLDDNDMFNNLTSSLSSTPSTTGTGTIDIVTGRSRYMPLDAFTKDTESKKPERTGIQKQLNTRSYNEMYKKENNPASGELDFTVDASRIYVSMKTNGDKCFGLTSELGRMPVGFVSGSIAPVDDAAYITLKSDELRLIARKQNENEYFPESTNPEINGSIKIIKEGVVNEDFAAVMLLPDGTIQINGSKIFLGRTIADGGTGGGPGEDESQPYVKYQDLENLWNATMDALDSFCQTLSTHTTPGYGAPSPQIIEAAATLKAEIASALKPDIVNIQSTRIFGE